MKNHLVLRAVYAVLCCGMLWTALQAACPSPAGKWIGANQVAPYQAMSGVLGADIRGHYWVLGSGETVNSGSCVVDGSSVSIIQDDGLGNKFFTGDWSNGCNQGCIAATDTAVLMVEQRGNEGTAAHYSTYSLTRVTLDAVTGGFNTDRVTNGAASGYGGYTCPGSVNCVTPRRVIPIPMISSDPATGATYNRFTGVGTILVLITQPSVMGYSSPGAGTGAAISGYQVYQLNNFCNVYPTTSNASGWNPVFPALTNADCVSGTCSKLVTVNPVAFPHCAWFSIGFRFEDGTNSSFVSGTSQTLPGATAVNGLPTRLDVISQTTDRMPGAMLRWTTTNESMIAGFNLLVSRSASSGYVRMNNEPIPTAGSPNTYERLITRGQLVARLGVSSAWFVKLQVLLRDATTTDVGPQPITFPRPPGRDCANEKPGIERSDCGP